ncbi:hypothetical protein [Qipengyuania zhejiangensis]|uniref:hypothetical protein n=1 Tax=Qipengyuania zhejiangensis TaxID=3077782 RepID=UPI002D79D094|nr:hypothetical protein [Qipengyuania sp. Z2]
MVLVILFALGVANFAVNKAVIESGHPVLSSLPAFFSRNGGRVSLMFEFTVLLTAMLVAANGWPGAAIVYAIYSALNLGMGWMVLTGRV